MNTIEVGQRLVELTSAGKDPQALDELYADNVVSVEGNTVEGEGPSTWEGLAAVKEKHDWWNGQVTLHESTAEGPYAGGADNHFVVKFWMDVTMTGQERVQMTEVGVFTVEQGKIVREVYLPLVQD